MAFDPNTQDFDTYLQTAIQQGVAAAMAGQTPAAAAPGAVPAAIPGVASTAIPAPDGGVTLMVDGKPYTFSNTEEASAAVQETLNQHRAAAQPVQSAQAAASDAKPVFEQAQYVELMGRDPVAAADYLDQFRENKDREQVKNLAQEIQTNKRMMAAYQFKDAHPEFMFMQNGTQMIEATLKANNWDFTPANLEAALATAQSRGQLPTRDQVQQHLQANATAQNQVAAGTPSTALPNLPPPGQVPAEVPIQGAVAPAAAPMPVMQPGTHFAGPPHLNPAMGPNPTYPPVAAPSGYNPNAAPGAGIAPPAIGTPTAVALPTNWVDQADNLSTEQIEQIFRQQSSQM